MLGDIFTHMTGNICATGALHWTREVRLARGISDHAPLNLTIALAESSGLKLWYLSRFWATDERIQEAMTDLKWGIS